MYLNGSELHPASFASRPLAEYILSMDEGPSRQGCRAMCGAASIGSAAYGSVRQRAEKKPGYVPGASLTVVG